MAVLPVAAGPVAAAGPQPAPSAGPRFGEVLRQRAGGPAEPARPPALASRALASVQEAQRQLDAVLAQARSGRTFSGAELLALQARAYRFAHTVELASKVVEQGAQTVKQAVQTPV